MTLKPPPGFSLRPLLPSDAAEVSELFRASIEVLAEDDYGDAQRAAWAGAANDEAQFVARLAPMTVLVALSGPRIAGFVALEGGESLHMLYTHPDFARRGIATYLLRATETLARGRKAARLKAEVSDTAHPLFMRHGFVPLRRNSVLVGEEWLANTSMEKVLGER